MKSFRMIGLTALVLLVLAGCASVQVEPPPEVTELTYSLTAPAYEVEVGGLLPLSFRIASPGGELFNLIWITSAGEISRTAVVGEADFLAPDEPGDVTITVRDRDNNLFKDAITISVLPEGALKTTADVLIEVDTSTLSGVWCSLDHPSETFTPPLKIKGTFRFNPDTLAAVSGGSWPTYKMYDDGTHGDQTADDGVWSLMMKFEKSDAMVYFAFDDDSDFRVQYESGLAWRLKMAWIGLDDYPDDNSNPAFVPDGDKTLRWTAHMAEAGGIYEPIE